MASRWWIIARIDMVNLDDTILQGIGVRFQGHSCKLRKWFFCIYFILLYFILFLLFILLQLFQLSLPFLHLHSAPPFPLPHQFPQCHVHWLCINVFWLIPSPSFIPFPLPPFQQLSVCFMYLTSVTILFISLLCSLDSTYKWDHVVFFFHWLA